MQWCWEGWRSRKDGSYFLAWCCTGLAAVVALLSLLSEDGLVLLGELTMTSSLLFSLSFLWIRFFLLAVLQDGRIFLAGSNPHQFYSFNVEFPTELRLEAFSPPYLNDMQSVMKPTIVAAPQQVNYGAPFTILMTTPVVLTGLIEVNLVSSPFVTHSFAQGQRLLSLDTSGPVQTAANTYEITATAPSTPMIAPPSYYMLFAVNQGIPSIAAWVQLLAPIWNDPFLYSC